MVLEHGCDRRSVVCGGARYGGELLEEFVPAARGEDHDQFAGFVGEVQERVRLAGRQVGKAARLDDEALLADLDLEATVDGVEGLVLVVMDVQGWAAMGRDFADEVIEGAAGVLAGDLEDEVSARAGLQAQALLGARTVGGDVVIALIASLLDELLRYLLDANNNSDLCACQIHLRNPRPPEAQSPIHRNRTRSRRVSSRHGAGCSACTPPSCESSTADCSETTGSASIHTACSSR